jgi:Mrp family chromosome partitioning ATPase
MTTTTLLCSLAANLAVAGVAGVAVGSAFLPSRTRQLRSETQLVQVLGAPLLAARPLDARALAAQLVEHWFRRGRAMLPLVSAERDTGRTRAAVQLAQALAAMGENTLLIDADFRSPGVHSELGLPNRAGLTDFLEGRGTALAHCGENLSVLVAGRSGADPLDLLSRPRMQALLAEAVQRYDAVLIDTPASACGPDLQLFAAYGGGARVVTRRSDRPAGLKRLRELLVPCKACIVCAVLEPA